MAELLGEVLFETSAQGPPPNKDFYCFSVTRDQIVWRWWKISIRLNTLNPKPGELKESHEDFLEDRQLLNQLESVFGHRVLEYSKLLCQGLIDFLPRMPDPLLLRIMTYLELEDVAQLALTCHKFNQLCKSQTFWEQAVQLRCNTITPGMKDLARDLGWRFVFFTNKLQLQKQISRRRTEMNAAPRPPSSNKGQGPSQ